MMTNCSSKRKGQCYCLPFKIIPLPKLSILCIFFLYLHIHTWVGDNIKKYKVIKELGIRSQTFLKWFNIYKHKTFIVTMNIY